MLFYFFNGRNGVRTCRHFGISRQTFYRWKRRFDRHDLTTLEEPLASATQGAPADVDGEIGRACSRATPAVSALGQR